MTNLNVGGIIGGSAGRAQLSATLLLIDQFSGPMRRIEKRVGAFESSVAQGFGKSVVGMTKAVGGFGAAIAVAGRAVAGFEKQIAGISAIAGASSVDEFSRVRQQAIDLSKTYSATAQEIAEGQRFIAQTGAKLNEILAATEPILALATSTLEEFDLAAQLTIKTLNAFGQEISNVAQVNRVVNNLQFAVNNSVNTLKSLNDALKFSAPFANTLGISLEDLVSALQLTANAGLEAGIAGRSIGQAFQQVIRQGMKGSSKESKILAAELTNVVNTGGTLADMVRLLESSLGGLSAAEVSTLNSLSELTDEQVRAIETGESFISTTSRLQTLIEVFGVRGARVFATLLGQSDQLDKFRTQMEQQVVRAADQARVALDNLADRSQIAFNRLQAGLLQSGFAEKLNQQLEGALSSDAFEELGEIIGKTLGEAADDVIPELVNALEDITVVLADIGPVVADSLGLAVDVLSVLTGLFNVLPDDIKSAALGFLVVNKILGGTSILSAVLSKKFAEQGVKTAETNEQTKRLGASVSATDAAASRLLATFQKLGPAGAVAAAQIESGFNRAAGAITRTNAAALARGGSQGVIITPPPRHQLGPTKQNIPAQLPKGPLTVTEIKSGPGSAATEGAKSAGRLSSAASKFAAAVGRFGKFMTGLGGIFSTLVSMVLIGAAGRSDNPRLRGAASGASIGGTIGTVVGGIVGSVAPGPGTLAGAAIGGAAGTALGGIVGGLKKPKVKEEVKRTMEDVLSDTEVINAVASAGDDAAKRWAAAFRSAITVEEGSIAETMTRLLADVVPNSQEISTKLNLGTPEAERQLRDKKFLKFGDGFTDTSVGGAFSRVGTRTLDATAKFANFFGGDFNDERTRNFQKQSRSNLTVGFELDDKRLFDLLGGADFNATDERAGLASAINAGRLNDFAQSAVTDILRDQAAVRTEIETQVQAEIDAGTTSEARRDARFGEIARERGFSEQTVMQIINSVATELAGLAAQTGLNIPAQSIVAALSGTGATLTNVGVGEDGQFTTQQKILDGNKLEELLPLARAAVEAGEELGILRLSSAEATATLQALASDTAGLASGIAGAQSALDQSAREYQKMNQAVVQMTTSIQAAEAQIVDQKVSTLGVSSAFQLSNAESLGLSTADLSKARQDAAAAAAFQAVIALEDAKRQVKLSGIKAQVQGQELTAKGKEIETVLASVQANAALIQQKIAEAKVRKELLDSLLRGAKDNKLISEEQAREIQKSLDQIALVEKAYIEAGKNVQNLAQEALETATEQKKINELLQLELQEISYSVAQREKLAEYLGISLDVIENVTDEELKARALAQQQTILRQQLNSRVEQAASAAGTLGGALTEFRENFINAGASAKDIDDALKQFRRLQFLQSTIQFIEGFQQLAVSVGREANFTAQLDFLKKRVLEEGGNFIDDLFQIADPTSFAEIAAQGSFVEQTVSNNQVVNINAELIFDDSITPNDRQEITRIALEAIGDELNARTGL